MINHTLQSINPKNHIAINSWNVHSKEEVDAIINNAVKAQLSWGDLNLNARINNVNELAHIIDDKKKTLINPNEAIQEEFFISALTQNFGNKLIYLNLS